MSDSGILLQPLLAYGLWVFFVMATKCTKCGKLVSQIKRRHRCRSNVESEPETGESIMKLSLHMSIWRSS